MAVGDMKLNILAWGALGFGAILVIAFPALALMLARSRFLPKNPVKRREWWPPLLRLLPMWLYLTFILAKTACNLLSDAPEPHWVFPVMCFLTGMMIWSSVESVVSVLKRDSDRKHEQEAYRRDTLSES